MSEPIDLDETEPGVWSFAQRIALGQRKPSQAERDATHERFFDALAGEPIRPKRSGLGSGAIALLMLTAVGCIIISLAGHPELIYAVPMLLGVAITVMIVLPGLMIGMSFREIFRSLIRP